MRQANPKMRNLTKRLIAYEVRRIKSPEARASTAVFVIDKLRPRLAMIMGHGGFRALLSRALADAEVPWLRAVHVKADGSLEGLGEPGTQIDPDDVCEGIGVLLAELLGLLATFIGEGLTLRLVREVWPKVPVNDLDAGQGGKNEKAK